MFRTLKAMRKKLLQEWGLLQGYRSDRIRYKKWNYCNGNVQTKNAFEAKILRQAHILEKGMSVSAPKPHFGVEKAEALLDQIDAFEAKGYRIADSRAVINAIGVLGAYLMFHKERGFVPEKVAARTERLRRDLRVEDGSFGVSSISLSDLRRAVGGSFPVFFESRHSVRQFSENKIDPDDVKKAVRLAMRAPSACNRQPWKVYFYTSPAVNDALGEQIAGNTGFSGEVQNYLVITGDLSAYHDAFERNQVYVDGGIFTLALVEALHYHGIASCILQNGEHREADRMIRRICGNIPENEKIVVFIAIGYYRDEVVYATSHRKDPDDVLRIK